MSVTLSTVLFIALWLIVEVQGLGVGLVDRSASIRNREITCATFDNMPTIRDNKRSCVENNSKTFDLPFLFAASPNSRQLIMELKCNRLNCFAVYLFYDSNGKFENCKAVNEMDRVGNYMMTCNSSTSVSDREPGRYCVRYIEYGALSSGQPCYRGTKFSSMTLLTTPEPDPSAVVYTDYMYTNNLAYLSIIPLVVVMLVVVVVFYTQCKDRKKPRREPGRNPPSLLYSIAQAIKETKPVNVFLLYSRECPHHQHVVNCLAKFLTANNCQVVYDACEINEIASNKVGWVEEKLSGKYKIILVVSKNCFEKQQAFLVNEKKSLENMTWDESLFVQAIATIMNRTEQAFDYSNLFVVRPEYIAPEYVLRGISPGRTYLLPRNIGTLVCHLHEMDNQLLSPQVNTIEQWSHCPYVFNEFLKSIDVVLKEFKFCEHCSNRTIATV